MLYPMLLGLSLFLGLLSWSFVEYLVHGILAHRYQTFVTTIHGQHHGHPEQVFTSPASWVPVALILFLAGVPLVGTDLAAGFVFGLLIGFLHYEWVHWHIHFRPARTARQRRLRDHHLAHHHVNPRAYHGVTTRFWDRVFGTLPSTFQADYARVEARPPLQGESNFRTAYLPWTARP